MPPFKVDAKGNPTLPTDDFGYVNYLKSFLEHAEHLSRQSGRTTKTLESLKPGDILVVHSSNVVRWMKDQLVKFRKLKGKKAIDKLDGIQIVYTDPKKFEMTRAIQNMRDGGNLVFDHVWMYLHIQWRLDRRANLAGRHGAGAALNAAQKHGAIEGRGIGCQGRSYGIPTKDRNIETLPIRRIEGYVFDFLEYAYLHPKDTFNVTEIGCGLAGYTPQDIAPLFRNRHPNVKLPRSFLDVLEALEKDNWI